jgi:ribose-phosphate pyrophosphokinase
LGNIQVARFSDGEFAVSFEESVRGQSVYIVQSTCPSSDNIMELLLAIDAAKRASAYKVIAVIPYFGWARQDRKDKPRVSIGAKVCANLLQGVGVDRVITVDLHADQIQGFFDVPVDHLYGANVLADYVQRLNLENLIVASPDVGGTKRASVFAKKLTALTKQDVPMVICYKHRPNANQIGEMRVLGDVKDKNVVIIDDIADTAGTLCNAANALKERGAKSVRACATHGVLSGPAIQRIKDSAIEELILLDTIQLPEEKQLDKIEVVTVAEVFAEAFRIGIVNKEDEDITKYQILVETVIDFGDYEENIQSIYDEIIEL